MFDLGFGQKTRTAPDTCLSLFIENLKSFTLLTKSLIAKYVKIKLY